MGISIEATGQACGAFVRGVDLSKDLDEDVVGELRSAWLEHHVLIFPEQDLDDDGLEQFTQCFGDFGDDPYVAPISGREHVIAIERSATETAPVFAENWHTDWSFQARPPAGTCLYGIAIPPLGGDTQFVNQQAAAAQMPAELRERLVGVRAIHSARGGYAPSGMYGDADADNDRAMQIEPSASAMQTQEHPVLKPHPESGEPTVFGCVGYIIGLVDHTEEQGKSLLMDLYAWQTSEQFLYSHRWEQDMLVMWDNRSVLHRATGGYDGHHRLLHRTTIAAATA